MNVAGSLSPIILNIRRIPGHERLRYRKYVAIPFCLIYQYDYRGFIDSCSRGRQETTL